MTCDEVRELLSGYCDGELEASAHEQVRLHLLTCRECAEEAQVLSGLGRLLASLGQCHPPEHLWERITTAVALPSGGDEPGRLAARPNVGLRAVRRRWVAAAALIAIVSSFSSSWIAARTWLVAPQPQPIQTTFGLALGAYVQELDEDNKDVFDRFLAMHQGREVSPDELVRQVGFTPLVLQELPNGLRLDKSYVLATTCCNAIELRYVKGSQLVTVFQQGRGHPVLFDGFETETTRIDGVLCRRGRVGDIVIVNFDGAGRNTTLLARANYSEIPTMVQLLNATP